MRRKFLIAALVLVLSGCKTVEVVEVTVDHPLAGVHIVAKFEANERSSTEREEATATR